MFKDLSSWHIQFVVNCWYEEEELEYIRSKESIENIKWEEGDHGIMRYYTEYKLSVGYH